MKVFHSGILALFAAFLIFQTGINAQEGYSKMLKKVIELKIPEEQSSGKNGAGVAWHPRQQKYYAAIAGNEDFGLSVFDAKGKLLSSPELKTMTDIRGIWYNPGRDAIQINGHGDIGWLEYVLDTKGIPKELKEIRKGSYQPADQSVGAFDYKENILYFYNAKSENLSAYDYETGDKKAIYIALGAKDEYEDMEILSLIFEDEDFDPSIDYNYTTIIYTGISGAEIGFLNDVNRQIELYSIQSGYKTRELKIPAGVKAYEGLNFSYANETYWLFDKEERVWIGLR